MKVSVVLPIYNGEETLEQTLKSLVEQTFQSFELVACIDGTTDRSKEILNAYAAYFQKVTVLENNNNLGLGPTMNRLIANSNGEYIAVAEQDDYYYPYRLEKQVAILNSRNDVGLVSGIAEFWNGNSITGTFPGILVGGKPYPTGRDMFLLNYRNQIKVVNSCMMFRKSIHIDKGLYFTQHYPSISVDWAYILRFSLISKIYGIPEVLVRLDRRTDRKSVTTYKEKQFKASRELLRSFAYEYPNIISKREYTYALGTQKIMELNHTFGFRFVFQSMLYILRNPFDARLRVNLINRFKRKF
ncbi:glycosyltransferase family 2 protein [Marixanthomonas sp. SCSIO 43207]|uniref:glycosyltransferase family 2 protein n=1 Tax=Marixanthomonas sp. SCSIO 43207 TaxID=2779360 RepID=UPI001CA9B5CF|nr:glycosyltransferase family 2 protein [Marixanthomonas sp. SCSIO 43207]UAB81220.1 glycosyltransferase family 2 protein [Marixanthomonas sp. SCSIO 43207]